MESPEAADFRRWPHQISPLSLSDLILPGLAPGCFLTSAGTLSLNASIGEVLEKESPRGERTVESQSPDLVLATFQETKTENRQCPARARDATSHCQPPPKYRSSTKLFSMPRRQEIPDMRTMSRFLRRLLTFFRTENANLHRNPGEWPLRHVPAPKTGNWTLPAGPPNSAS